MIYLLIAIISAVLIGAAVVGCSKPGKKEGICKYDKEDEKNDL